MKLHFILNLIKAVVRAFGVTEDGRVELDNGRLRLVVNHKRYLASISSIMPYSNVILTHLDVTLLFIEQNPVRRRLLLFIISISLGTARIERFHDGSPLLRIQFFHFLFQSGLVLSV